MTSLITVLRTRGPKLTKTWLADGAIGDYDNAKTYTARQVEITGLDALYTLLSELQGDPRSCIIRGVPAAPIAPRQVVQRNLDTFADAPSQLLMLDVDQFEPIMDSVEADPAGAVAEFVATLPACFREANYIWQLSGSCGHPSRAGKLRAHIWFWLAAPLTCQDAETWAAKYGLGADNTVHRTVQVNYTGAPVLEAGQVDPLAGRRLGRHTQALRDLLIIPADMPVPAGETRSVKRKERATAMIDPREKPGVIGALCRAFEPTAITTLWPELFEEGRKPERITWLGGNGAKEGLRITDNGTHIFNSQSTAPVKGAVNMFDFIRAHVYGHLDAGIDEDVLELDITAAPSYKATVEWALTQAEVQAELGSDAAVAAVEKKADAQAEVVLSEREERAQRMINIQALIERCNDLDTLENDIGRRVAKGKSFSAADREVIAAAMQVRSRVLTPGGRGLSINLVRGWLRPASAAVGPEFPHTTPEGMPRLTIENVEALCAAQGIEIQYNVISKRVEIRGLDSEYGRDNANSASLADLQSRMAALGMPNTTSAVTGIITAIAAKNEFNPVVEWIESAPWDGVSRVADLVRTVTVKAGAIEPQVLHDIVDKWLIQAAAAAASPKPIQLRGVLVFAGEQYIGKTRWLKSLVPPEHEDWIIAGRSIDPHNKDSINAAVSHWLCELGELDGSFRRSDVAALKAWISNDEDVYRKPYAAQDSKLQRRTVCFATVNGDEFLQDDTGNTRFWVVPVMSVDPQHGLDMQQVWAEALHRWRAGETHWLDRTTMAAVQTHTVQFEVSDEITDLLLSQHPWDTTGWRRPAGVELNAPVGADPTAMDAPVWVRWSATDIARRLGLGLGRGSSGRIGARLRKLGALGGTTGAARWWEVPVPGNEIGDLK